MRKLFDNLFEKPTENQRITINSVSPILSSMILVMIYDNIAIFSKTIEWLKGLNNVCLAIAILLTIFIITPISGFYAEKINPKNTKSKFLVLCISVLLISFSIGLVSKIKSSVIMPELETRMISFCFLILCIVTIYLKFKNTKPQGQNHENI